MKQCYTGMHKSLTTPRRLTIYGSEAFAQMSLQTQAAEGSNSTESTNHELGMTGALKSMSPKTERPNAAVRRNNGTNECCLLGKLSHVVSSANGPAAGGEYSAAIEVQTSSCLPTRAKTLDGRCHALRSLHPVLCASIQDGLQRD